MNLSPTQLTDKPLFPQKKTLTDSFNDNILDNVHIDIAHENHTDISKEQRTALTEIEALDCKLLQHFHNKIKLQPILTRQLVSFQANKPRPSYRWYKYKEAFSASLIEYLLSNYGITSGKVLDPFAGSGTTLFAASAYGLDADGIELLPIGQQIISARKCLEREFIKKDIASLNRWITDSPWRKTKARKALPRLRITDGAYPKETLDSIEQYIGTLKQENERVQLVLQFALLCVLESIGFTRKDGQCLRWDYRSGRRQGAKPFNKGAILNFDKAICDKINEICRDLQSTNGDSELFPSKILQGNIHLLNGSCLDIMPTLPNKSYNAIVTSPPYCNRYDYTRTYALELALLNIGEKELTKLRQEMLSCTVENRAKDLLQINPKWTTAIEAAESLELLQTILCYLEDEKAHGRLNNNGIPRMVRGYFYEMACVISECKRVLKHNALLFMVNDNVRYAGASISVDLILTNIAEKLGFHVENILVLPNGKGNSSQQMERHGRNPLRKCVYVWRKILYS
ncbi:MAG: site-specific DNA-methyltransferase [Nitrospirae bacterium]|nr:site-specific DNA-methyltransferase [Nitrospirota bacterium]